MILIDIYKVAKIELEVGLHLVRDLSGNTIPVENAFADGDGDITVDLAVHLPNHEQQAMLSYLEKHQIFHIGDLKARLNDT